MRVFPLVATLSALASCTFPLDRVIEAGDVRGRAVFTDPSGRQLPARDAVVRVVGTTLVHRADADGRFVLRRLPSSKVTLLLAKEDQGLRLAVDVATGLDLGTVVLGRYGRILATVRRGADSVEATLVVSTVREVRTSSGAAVVEALAPGKYELFVRDAAGKLYALPEVTVLPGVETPLEVDLAGLTALETASVQGLARLADGTTHVGIEITAGAGLTSPLVTDARGFYLDVAAQPGVHTLRATKEGYRTVTLPSVVFAGEVVLPDLLLTPASEACGGPGATTDADDDFDGVPDATEPAPCRCSAGTTDADADGVCDDVDRDLDGDGIDDAVDNCLGKANATQADADADGLGDACDPLCGGTDCATLDSPCAQGFCDPSTKACATRLLDGATCDDGDACTLDDTCAEGGCRGTVRDCSELDGACAEGTCNADTGACEKRTFDDDTACDDRNACTTDDVCTGGVCEGAPITCSQLDAPCQRGVCDPDTGACGTVDRDEGLGCDDGLRCTTSDTCHAGACAGTAVDCSSLDGLCSNGVCDPGTGACVAAAANPGAACDDDNVCRWGATCTTGGCGTTYDCATDVARFTAAGADPAPVGAKPVAFSDACPEGSVLVGIETRPAIGGHLTDLRGVCAALSTTSGTAPTLVIGAHVVTPADPGRGDDGGTSTLVRTVCPEGTAVVGATVASVAIADGIDGIALKCGAIRLAGGAAVGYRLELDATSPTTVTIGSGATAGTSDCPGGTVARGHVVAAGTVVETYGLTCATPRFDIVTSLPPPVSQSSGGAGRVEDCPPGQAVIGVEGVTATGFYQNILGKYATRCGVLARSGDTVTVSAGTRIPETGAYAMGCTCGTPAVMTCPANQVVVGFSTDIGGSPQAVFNAVRRIELRCAPLTVTGDEISGLAAQVGTVTPTAKLGTVAGSSFGPSDCPPGTIARGVRLQTGDILNSFNLRCGKPRFPSF